MNETSETRPSPPIPSLSWTQRARDEASAVTRGRPVAALLLVAVALVPLAIVNAIGLAQTALWLIREGAANGDWSNLSAVTIQDPYAAAGFRWSPPAAWLLATLIVPLGLPIWQVLHLIGVALTRDWRVIAVALLSWPFWQDLANGNVMIFVVLAAWWALAGNRFAAVAFIALAVLIPRPLMLPVLGWLLLRQPWTRLWFVGLAVAVFGLSLVAGQLDDFAERLLVTGSSELSTIWNIGPSRLLGPAWIPIGIALAAALAWKGWLGLASVVISPYLFPYYALMALLDVPRLLGRPQPSHA
ncbi:MAG TPA: hypothetical protein VJ975_09660 [Candidatus Limnocylindria bacterium]|nr:hypothetical protein [Candidatus Limnocylindria bacterium]